MKRISAPSSSSSSSCSSSCPPAPARAAPVPSSLQLPPAPCASSPPSPAPPSSSPSPSPRESGARGRRAQRRRQRHHEQGAAVTAKEVPASAGKPHARTPPAARPPPQEAPAAHELWRSSGSVERCSVPLHLRRRVVVSFRQSCCDGHPLVSRSSLKPRTCHHIREPTVLSRVTCRSSCLNIDRFHQNGSCSSSDRWRPVPRRDHLTLRAAWSSLHASHWRFLPRRLDGTTAGR